MNSDQKIHRLLITYDLLDLKRTTANRKNLFALLDSLGAKRIQDSLWIVQTEMSVESLFRKLVGHFSHEDRLFIAQYSESVRRKRTITLRPRGLCVDFSAN